MARASTTLLVIEDDAGIRANLVEFFAEEGFDVLEASDGLSGLALARRERPSLILCDVGMQGLDGFDVLKALRASSELAHTPFVFLSGAAAQLSKDAGIEAGADAYLTKPFTLSTLLATVRSGLERLIAA